MDTFVKLKRCNKYTNEHWADLINLNEMVGAEEHRISKNRWADDPGYRRGYDILLKGGFKIWVSDREYENILRLFGNKIIEF